LRTFLTKSQWESWVKNGFFKIIGSVTGRAYRIHHRATAAAKGLSHTVMDIASGRTICAWDDTVPAEEEALVLAFAVGHREGWFLNLTA